MNVIVSNKQKNVIDGANIDAIKDLNGLFEVDELINNCKGYFFSKIIIDATSIVDFAKENVLKKLVSGIGAEKIVLLLPEKPEPPKRFCDFLIFLGIKSFSTNITDIINFLKNSNIDSNINNDMNDIYDNNYSNINSDLMNENSGIVIDSNVDNNVSESVNDINHDKKIVLGFKNVTLHAGSTTLIYMIKQQLEKNYKLNVEAFEINDDVFKYFNVPNMYQINYQNLEMTIKNSRSNIILLDINNNDDIDYLCDDIIYLVEPSILKINKLLSEKRDIFTLLNDKKVVLNKSILTNEEVSIFAKEAGIKIYFSISYVNDRNDNQVIKEFIDKLDIANKGGQGLFGLFNREN